MKIDKELVEKVARVARLELTETEKDRFRKDFQEILEAFSRLKGMDTADTKPTLHPVSIRPSYRDDRPGKCLTVEEALSGTKHKEGDFFKGPRAV